MRSSYWMLICAGHEWSSTFLNVKRQDLSGWSPQRVFQTTPSFLCDSSLTLKCRFVFIGRWLQLIFWNCRVVWGGLTLFWQVLITVPVTASWFMRNLTQPLWTYPESQRRTRSHSWLPRAGGRDFTLRLLKGSFPGVPLPGVVGQLQLLHRVFWPRRLGGALQTRSQCQAPSSCAFQTSLCPHHFGPPELHTVPGS